MGHGDDFSRFCWRLFLVFAKRREMQASRRLEFGTMAGKSIGCRYGR